MRMAKNTFILVIACLFLLPSPVHAYGEGRGALALTQEDNGKTINGRVGQILVLTLEENPTTGYNWEMMDTNSNILSLKVSKYEQDDALRSRGLFGAGGKHIYVFKLSYVGTTQLQLIYKRPWEPEGIQNFSVIVDVAP